MSPTPEPRAERRALGYTPALDGVRAVAVLAVIAHHAVGRVAAGGGLGVDVFFVLSGYLITRLLGDEWRATGTIHFRTFYLKRAYRLLPALLACTLLAGVWWLLPHGDVAGVWSWPRTALVVLGYVGNFFWLHLGPLSHTWSLSVEEQYYTLWPVSFALLMRWRGRISPAWTVALVVAALAALRAWLRHADALAPEDLYAFTPARIDGILIGAWGAMVERTNAARRSIDALDAARAPLVAAAAFAVGVVLVRPYDAWLAMGGSTVIALASLAALLAIVHGERATAARAVLSSPALVWIGRRSYGLYLYHVVVFSLSGRLDVPRTGALGVAFQGARVVAAFGVAALSYRYVETPFLRRKQSLSRGPSEPPGSSHVPHGRADGVAAAGALAQAEARAPVPGHGA
jgi:peptidoglycan/LPS O-acetylase OafA/YrhL